MYRKILIATDGSDLASKAIDHGISLAKATGASVIFVTVTEIWSAIEMAADAINMATSNSLEKYEEAAAHSAQKILAAARAKAQDAGIECETIHVPDRAPAEGIIATTDAQGCDLIVMASHGRRGLNRVVLGSQTVEVLSYSKVPVLVLR